MYFDIDAHRDCFKTNPNEAYFWHGRTNNCGGQDNAMDIAGNNGKTLEMCMLEHRDQLEKAGVIFEEKDSKEKGKKIYSIDYNGNLEESNRFWEDCSKAFAEQASGNVHVIAGSDPRPNGQSEADFPSTYNRIEHPALEQNPHVNSIIHVSPDNGQQTGCEKFDRVSLSFPQNTDNNISGELPPQNTNSPASPEHQNQVSGTLPDQALGIELPNNHTSNAAGKDLAETATKKNSTNFNSSNGIS